MGNESGSGCKYGVKRRSIYGLGNPAPKCSFGLFNIKLL